MNETKKQEVKMTYYQRVQAFRDNQQALLDDFLAEVVSSKTITKSNENHTLRISTNIIGCTKTSQRESCVLFLYRNTIRKIYCTC